MAKLTPVVINQSGNAPVQGALSAWGSVGVDGTDITPAARWMGGKAGSAPTTGTFVAGDFIIDKMTPALWICTVSGRPGTWVNAGSGGGGGQSLILNYAAAVDLALSQGAAAYWSFGPTHNFTVANSASLLYVSVIGTVVAQTSGGSTVASRLSIDNPATDYWQLGGFEPTDTASRGNVLAGAGYINIGSRAAGAHTLNLQVYNHLGNVNFACNAATDPAHSLRIQVTEVLP